MSLTSGTTQGCPGLCSHTSWGGLWSGGLVCSWSCRLMARWSLLWPACSTSQWLSGWSCGGEGLAWNGVSSFSGCGLWFWISFQEKITRSWCHKCVHIFVDIYQVITCFSVNQCWQLQFPEAFFIFEPCQWCNSLGSPPLHLFQFFCQFPGARGPDWSSVHFFCTPSGIESSFLNHWAEWRIYASVD